MGKDQDLLDAARNGNVAVIEKLLSHRLSRKTGQLFNPLKGMVDTIRKALSPNCKDANGDTPLHLAALNGHRDAVSCLLLSGAALIMVDSRGCNVLHLAAWNGHADICRDLLSHGGGLIDFNEQNNQGETALLLASQYGHSEVVMVLLEHNANTRIKDHCAEGPLDVACRYGRLETVRLLLKESPDLVLISPEVPHGENSPLHLAARNGHYQVVQLLLESGFNINIKTEHGTALHESSVYGKDDVVEYLLEEGIDVYETDREGRTALEALSDQKSQRSINIGKAILEHLQKIGLSPTKPRPASNSSFGDEIFHSMPESVLMIPSSRNSLTSKGSVSSYGSAFADLPHPRRQISSEPKADRRAVPVDDPDYDVPVPSSTASLAINIPGPTISSRMERLSASPAGVFTSETVLSSSPKSPKSKHEAPKKPPRRRLTTKTQPMPGMSTSVMLGDIDDVESSLLHRSMSASMPDSVTESLESQRSSLESHRVAARSLSGVVPEQDNNYTEMEVEDLEIEQDLEDNESAAKLLENVVHANRHNIECQGLTSDVPTLTGHAQNNLANVIFQKEARSKLVLQDLTCDGLDVNIPPATPSTEEGLLLEVQYESQPHRDTVTPTDQGEDSQQAEGEGGKPEVGEETKEDSESKSPSRSSAHVALKHTKSAPATHPDKSTHEQLNGRPNFLGVRDKPKSASQKAKKNGVTIPGGTEATPDVPPPSPATARQGIQKVLAQEKRRSRDMETLTESCYMSGGDSWKWTVDAETATSNQASPLPLRSLLKQAQAPTSSTEDLLTSDAEPFLGLTKGSILSTQPRAKSQIYDNVILYPKQNRRLSMPSSQPVSHGVRLLEGSNAATDENQDSTERSTPYGGRSTTERSVTVPTTAATGHSNTKVEEPGPLPLGARTNASDVTQLSETEEWAQIADIMASFGGGIARESVFIRDCQANFTRMLSAETYHMQSVGDWLEDLALPQYENVLIAHGFDDMEFMGPNVLEYQDLVEMAITNQSHVSVILASSAKIATVKYIGDDPVPVTVSEWLDSLHMPAYIETFLENGFSTVQQLQRAWEVELNSVLDIPLIGHQKRVLASLRNPHPPSPRDGSVRQRMQPNLRFSAYSPDITGSSLEELMKADRYVEDEVSPKNTTPSYSMSLSNTSDMFEDDEPVEIRPPSGTHISQWRHKPEVLVKGCCNYNVQYLGSTLVKKLVGLESTKESIARLKKSSANIVKIPSIQLSISFKGVKFIDGRSKKVICEHEISNIFCACQDGDNLRFFAYITRDLQNEKHYCHVFCSKSKDIATEVILTLGEAFEVAYQLAIRRKAQQPKTPLQRSESKA